MAHVSNATPVGAPPAVVSSLPAEQPAELAPGVIPGPFSLPVSFPHSLGVHPVSFYLRHRDGYARFRNETGRLYAKIPQQIQIN